MSKTLLSRRRPARFGMTNYAWMKLFLATIYVSSVACFQVDLSSGISSSRRGLNHRPSIIVQHMADETYSTITKSPVPTTETIKKTGLGKWEELHGNYILRPSIEDGPPRALLHFLGGALVGGAPHITYRYMLERLAEKGYLVVATPYNLSFDHLETCDAVIQRFERIAPMLARTYGALPVVGVGHSLGALLQMLISSLFPDTPRAANALMSFNNKPVSEAVPLFEELVAPLCTVVAQKNGTLPSGTEAISLGLRLTKSVSQGELPSEELVSQLLSFLRVPDGQQSTGIPDPLREVFFSVTNPATVALSNAGLLPFVGNTIDTLEQIPLLIDEIADGARDFVPTPESARAAARRAYRARRTLILKYTEDPLDESDEIDEILKEAERIIRMKRPMINIDVQKTDLSGGHAAPLIAPPLDIASQAEDLLGSDAAKQGLLYSEADATVEALTRWLEEGNL